MIQSIVRVGKKKAREDRESFTFGRAANRGRRRAEGLSEGLEQSLKSN